MDFGLYCLMCLLQILPSLLMQDLQKNENLTFQLRYLIVLMDGRGNCNIVLYGSIKSRRVTETVCAAELRAMAQGFDVDSTIRHAMNNIFGRTVLMKLYTDSWKLFDCLTNNSLTTEERLLIDLRILRHGYDLRVLTKVF